MDNSIENYRDEEDIMDLVGESKFAEMKAKYGSLAHRSKQAVFVNDINSGTYNNLVQFDTQAANQQYKSWANAWLVVPLMLVSSNPTTTGSANSYDYNGQTPIAWKSSSLNLFQGVQISFAASSTLVSEQRGTYFHSLIRQYLEHDANWVESSGVELGFYPPGGVDSQNATLPRVLYAGGALNATATNVQTFGYVSGGSPATTSLTGGVDMGFAQRVVYFQRQMTVSNKVISYNAYIPLAALHDFFAQSCIMINDRFLFDFYSSCTIRAGGSSGAQAAANATNATTVNDSFQPFQCGIDLLHNGSYGQVPPPLVFIGSAVQLWYEKLELAVPVEEYVLERMRSPEGLTKSIKYLACVPPVIQTGITATQKINSIISNGVQAVQRVFLLAYPTTMLASQTTATPALTYQLASNLSGASTQIQVNNVNHLQRPYQYPLDFFNALKGQFLPSSTSWSSIINFDSWSNGVLGVLCFDLRRVASTLPNKNQAITIGLDTVRNGIDQSTIDVVTIIEVQREVVIRLSSATNAVVVGLAN